MAETNRYRFHAEAWSEYEEAVRYYQRVASQKVMEGFLASVRKGMNRIVEVPTRCPPKGDQGLRACRLERFPYSIIYLFDAAKHEVFVLAIAHSKRRPAYWKSRLGE